MTISRRGMLMSAAAGVLPRILHAADQADQSRMIVRSPRPEDLEMPLDGFTDWLTPIDRFFVRCHTYTPKVNLNEWSLKIDGVVEQPITLAMGDLKKFPRTEAGGRGFGYVPETDAASTGRAFPVLSGISARLETRVGRAYAFATFYRRPVSRLRPNKFFWTAPTSRLGRCPIFSAPSLPPRRFIPILCWPTK